MEELFKDAAYEEDLLRNPYNLKAWWYYLEYKKDAAPEIRNVIYERALRNMPRSYKLWVKYLQERVDKVKHLCVADIAYQKVNNCFVRCLVHMHKMPKIWKEYLTFLMRQHRVTETRHAFDDALRALPITQHLRWIWPSYIAFARECGVPETASRIYRRYLKIAPLEVEDFIKYLKKNGRLDQAALHLGQILNDDEFVSQKGKSKHDLWTELLNIITKNPDLVRSLDVEAIIRGGLRRFTHEVGRLWCALGDYYLRCGHFEKARDVYEEGINTVATVRDFSLIFDAYTQFEESMLAAKMEAAEEAVPEDEEEPEEDVDIELRLMRLEKLAQRRPLLLSSVLLRQNPHNVQEWHKRVALFKDDPAKCIMTFTDAVTTVDPQKASGKPQTLWVAFAAFYEKHGDLVNARVIFEKAVLVNFKSVDALASLWCEYAEMELRHDNYQLALEVMKKATTVPEDAAREWRKDASRIPVQQRLYRSTRLWSFYVDLEENMGTLESTKAVYERIVDLRAATPQIILNYAAFMEENKYFEDAFRVFEKGIALFKYPHVQPIWLAYLKKFITRYGGKKLERARDLFEQAVEDVPAKEAKDLFLLYAKFEEEHGLTRRAMQVYERACDKCAVEDKLQVHLIYITRCGEFFGVAKTREIYDRAFASLSDADVKPLTLKYADMERKLGEVDRARAIYTYGSQFCDPKTEQDYWKVWHEFEVAHGNEDTFREMLRIRRSVRAKFASVAMMGATVPATKPATEKPKRRRGDAMAAVELEEEEEAKEGGDASAEGEEAATEGGAHPEQKEEEEAKRRRAAQAATAALANPEEIDIGGDSSDEENSGDEAAGSVKIATKAVPDAVFGSAKEALGALDRFKQAQS